MVTAVGSWGGKGNLQSLWKTVSRSSLNLCSCGRVRATGPILNSPSELFPSFCKWINATKKCSLYSSDAPLRHLLVSRTPHAVRDTYRGSIQKLFSHEEGPTEGDIKHTVTALERLILSGTRGCSNSRWTNDNATSQIVVCFAQSLSTFNLHQLKLSRRVRPCRLQTLQARRYGTKWPSTANQLRFQIFKFFFSNF